VARQAKTALWVVAGVLLVLVAASCSKFDMGFGPPGDRDTAAVVARHPKKAETEAPAAVEPTAVESVAPAASTESAPPSAPESEIALDTGTTESTTTITVDSALESEITVVESDEIELPKAEADRDKKPEAEKPKATKTKTKGKTEADNGDSVPLPIDEEVVTGPVVGLKTIVAGYLDQAGVDARVALGHIEQATRSLGEEEDASARQSIQQAIRAATFVRVGLPTVLTREYLDRAVIESQNGRPTKAVETLKAAVSIANRVPLKGTVEQFRRRGALAAKAIDEEQPDRARELLKQMVGMVDTSDAELELDHLVESLRASLSALDRDARKAAAAELEGADDAARAILKSLQEE
jgi:hypothetical protein